MHNFTTHDLTSTYHTEKLILLTNVKRTSNPDVVINADELYMGLFLCSCLAIIVVHTLIALTNHKSQINGVTSLSVKDIIIRYLPQNTFVIYSTLFGQCQYQRRFMLCIILLIPVCILDIRITVIDFNRVGKT